tara:strand:- start:1593 stop:1988 length:396 start_codon:yes stop_codon:yes gene_type:complete
LSKPADLGSVKTGSYIVIDGEPCRIVDFDKSKPGKHGSAKARVVGVGIFDNIKRSIVSPVSSTIEIPLIEKRSAQIISLAPTKIQIMDLENYEISDIDIPEDEEIKNKLAAGKEVEFWRVLGKQKVVRVKG